MSRRTVMASPPATRHSAASRRVGRRRGSCLGGLRGTSRYAYGVPPGQGRLRFAGALCRQPGVVVVAYGSSAQLLDGEHVAAEWSTIVRWSVGFVPLSDSSELLEFCDLGVDRQFEQQDSCVGKSCMGSFAIRGHPRRFGHGRVVSSVEDCLGGGMMAFRCGAFGSGARMVRTWTLDEALPYAYCTRVR